MNIRVVDSSVVLAALVGADHHTDWALQQLADAEASSRVLERDVSVIDLRLAGKMIVRLAHDLPPPAKTNCNPSNCVNTHPT